MANGPLVRYSNVERCAVLALDHAPVNSLSLGLRRDLAAALTRAAFDDQAQAIVLIGAGNGFCAGGDLKEFGTPEATARPGVSADLHPAIERSTKPVIAAIHDIAMGGGLETALACHRRPVLRRFPRSGHFGLALPGAGSGVHSVDRSADIECE